MSSNYSLGIAETAHPADAYARLQIGQAFAKEYAANGNPTRVIFWTTPDGGGPGVNIGSPFDFQAYKVQSKGTIFSDQREVELEANTAGTVNISWATLDKSNSQIYVSMNGDPETLFASGYAGTQAASWIVAPNRYVFNLYEGDNRSELLASIDVIGRLPFVCVPNNVSGCKVCKSDGSEWVDDNTRCSSEQVCQSGICIHNVTTTTSTTSTTRTTSSTTSSTTTTPMVCSMPGNSPPCGTVSLSEVVAAINQWAAGSFNLGDVIGLINSWADPSGHPAS